MSDFDSIYITPRYSEIERGEIDLKTKFFGQPMNVPILSSPMDTISGIEMLDAIREAGGFGIHHRYCSLVNLLDAAFRGGIAASPSIELADIQTVMYNSPYKIIVLDVAHGHTKRNLDFCRELIQLGFNVVSGSICTNEAAEAYLKIGVNHLRVGIGSGSVCTTRTVTGVGRSQIKAIAGIKDEFHSDVKIISDGGHRNTGDIAKAFALGADYVMLGRMLASTEEAEGHGKYSGMASSEALKRRGKTEFFVEGRSEDVEVNTTVLDVMKNIKDALETTCYYTGSHNLHELYLNGYENKE